MIWIVMAPWLSQYTWIGEIQFHVSGKVLMYHVRKLSAVKMPDLWLGLSTCHQDHWVPALCHSIGINNSLINTFMYCAMHFWVSHWPGEFPLPVWNNWAPVSALVLSVCFIYGGQGLAVVMVLLVVGVGASFLIGCIVLLWIMLLPFDANLVLPYPRLAAVICCCVRGVMCGLLSPERVSLMHWACHWCRYCIVLWYSCWPQGLLFDSVVGGGVCHCNGPIVVWCAWVSILILLKPILCLTVRVVSFHSTVVAESASWLQ